MKPKTVAFLKNEDYEYCDIDTIINEIELLRCVNIIVKVILIEDVQSSRTLILQEYLVTDDGENTIPLTMSEDLAQVLKKKNATNKILNVQVVTYKNKKKLRSTRLTKIELMRQRICDNCKALLNYTTNTLIRCDTCSSVHLTKTVRKSFRYV